VLLNLDAGEHDDEPEELWALFDVLNVACGGHAGDDASMERVARFVAAHPPMRLGAHPSYPDRAGFGRATLAIEPAVLRASLVEQCARLASIARRHGLEIASVKLHGALYHDANRDPQLAELALDAIRAALDDVAIVGPERGAWADAARARGFAYLREGFADRARRADGSLVPRGEPGALITEPAAAAAQARALAGRSTGHPSAPASVDTLCVHADTPGALAIARAVRQAVP
jgi:UPF0271 protein